MLRCSGGGGGGGGGGGSGDAKLTSNQWRREERCFLLELLVPLLALLLPLPLSGANAAAAAAARPQPQELLAAKERERQTKFQQLVSIVDPKRLLRRRRFDRTLRCFRD